MADSIEHLLTEIEHNGLVMPAFQREYVWNLDQARELMGSLFRAYPTGSVLFWKTSNPPELKNQNVDLKPGTLITVILDGQQRLTTLYMLIKGKIPPYYSADDVTHDPRHLYFNLHTGDFKYYSKQEMETNPLWWGVVDLYATPPDPLEVAMKRVGEENLKEAVQLQKILNANLNRMKDILKMEYPMQLVPDTADVDDAIRIFDLVNRQGTKLSDAELALAHMSGHWPEARAVLKDKLAKLAAKGFDFDLTFLVRCMTAVITGRAEYELIQRREKDELLAGWESLDAVLDYLVGVLKSHAFVHSSYDLSTTNVLVPIVAYLVKIGGKFTEPADRNRFLHWMYAAMLWSRYSGQADQRLDKDVSIVLKSPDPTAELLNEILDQRGRIEVRASDLDGRDIRNPFYRMAFIVAKSRHALDWFNGVALSELGLENKGENNYVFPYDQLYKQYDSGNHLHRKRVNEIANRAILTEWHNTNSGSDPLQYLHTAWEKYPDSLRAYGIPKNPALWQMDRYEDFLEERRQIIAKNINQFMAALIHKQEARQVDLAALIAQGETEGVEFKESIRLNLLTGKVDKNLQEKVAREIAAMLNGEGGMLLVGVRDDGEIVGISEDVNSFDKPSADSLMLYVQGVIKTKIGMEHQAYVHLRIADVQDKPLLVIDVEASPTPVWFGPNLEERDFLVRLGTSAQKMDTKAAVDYIQQHWNSQ